MRRGEERDDERRKGRTEGHREKISREGRVKRKGRREKGREENCVY